MKSPYLTGLPLFALGFRVFFALAGLSALLLMVIWNLLRKGELTAATYYPPPLWHAHELLLGYGVAVLTGFALTAAERDGSPAVSGRPLFTLAMLWLYGRIVPFYEGLLPSGLIAAVDFSFLPLLAYRLAGQAIRLAARPETLRAETVRSKYYRHLGYLAVLLPLIAANGLIHAQLLGFCRSGAELGVELSVAVLITALLWAAGAFLPLITEKGLRGTLILRQPLLDGAAVAGAAAALAAYLAGVSGIWLMLAAVFAAVANGARAWAWHVRKIWYVPLLWVAYTAYAWVIAGFVLMAFSAYSRAAPAAVWHAFALGGIGIATLGMMARLTLTGAGRALRASHAAVLAFVAINAAAVVKILAPLGAPAWYGYWLQLSVWLWLLAFSLFVYTYMPMWLQEPLQASKN